MSRLRQRVRIRFPLLPLWFRNGAPDVVLHLQKESPSRADLSVRGMLVKIQNQSSIFEVRPAAGTKATRKQTKPWRNQRAVSNSGNQIKEFVKQENYCATRKRGEMRFSRLFLLESHGTRGFRRCEGIIAKACLLVKFDDDCRYVLLGLFDVFKRAELLPFC